MVTLLVGVNKAAAWTQKTQPWIPAGQAPVQIYKDFYIPRNSLSVWAINEPGEEMEVVEALAATKDNLQTYHYVLFDGDLLAQFDIAVAEVPGTTKRAGVNHLHRDIPTLTTEKFAKLAGVVYHEDVKIALGQKLGDGIRQAIDDNEIDKSGLKETLVDALYPSSTSR